MTITHSQAEAQPPIGEVLANFEEHVGMSFEQLKLNREDAQRRRTHCVLGGQALSLVEFEARHRHITLGQE